MHADERLCRVLFASSCCGQSPVWCREIVFDDMVIAIFDTEGMEKANYSETINGAILEDRTRAASAGSYCWSNEGQSCASRLLLDSQLLYIHSSFQSVARNIAYDVCDASLLRLQACTTCLYNLYTSANQHQYHSLMIRIDANWCGKLCFLLYCSLFCA